MNKNTIEYAKKMAVEFLESLKEMENAAEMVDCGWNGKEYTQKREYISPRYTAAVKRKSMDLTRALSDLRQGK